MRIVGPKQSLRGCGIYWRQGTFRQKEEKLAPPPWGGGWPMRGLKLIMWSQGQWEALKKNGMGRGQTSKQVNNTWTLRLLDQLSPEVGVGEKSIFPFASLVSTGPAPSSLLNVSLSNRIIFHWLLLNWHLHINSFVLPPCAPLVFETFLKWQITV